MNDIINNVQLQQNVIPPANLAIDSHTLLATWNPPDFSSCLLNEDWSGGAFLYQWLDVSGGKQLVDYPVCRKWRSAASSSRFPRSPAMISILQARTSPEFILPFLI